MLWFTLHFKGVTHISKCSALFMWARCPNVFFLLLTNPVIHSFDMAALSEKWTSKPLT